MPTQPKQTTSRSARHEVLLPEGWPKPRGYANGVLARGAMVFLSGQIGWNEKGEFPDGMAAQTRQALENIARLLTEAGALHESVVRMTWYVTDLDAYSNNLKEIGVAYRAVFGNHFPAMSVVQVVRLVEPKALVEIEATAVIPE
jgi:enamine deaminase RidA (YjgF/YER057c/UK114 family)